MKRIKNYLFQKIANTILVMMYYLDPAYPGDYRTMEKLYELGLLVDTVASYYGVELNRC